MLRLSTCWGERCQSRKVVAVVAARRVHVAPYGAYATVRAASDPHFDAFQKQLSTLLLPHFLRCFFLRMSGSVPRVAVLDGPLPVPAPAPAACARFSLSITASCACFFPRLGMSAFNTVQQSNLSSPVLSRKSATASLMSRYQHGSRGHSSLIALMCLHQFSSSPSPEQQQQPTRNGSSSAAC